MSDSPLFHLIDWQSAGLAAAFFLLALSSFVGRRMRARIHYVTVALNHMSQGLCMFDRSARIVVCNQQYLRMYKLSPDVVKPGCTLRRLIEHRKQTGWFTGDPEDYCQKILADVAAGKTAKWLIDGADGRMVQASNE